MTASSSTVRPCSTRWLRTGSWTIISSRTECIRRYGAMSHWRRGFWMRSCAASLALVDRNSGPPRINIAECADHFGLSAEDWRVVADSSCASQYFGGLLRYDPGGRQAKTRVSGGGHQTARSRRSARVNRPAEPGGAVGWTSRRGGSESGSSVGGRRPVSVFSNGPGQRLSAVDLIPECLVHVRTEFRHEGFHVRHLLVDHAIFGRPLFDYRVLGHHVPE